MDPAVCLANARKFDPNASLCADSRCNAGGTSKYLNARCHCSPPFQQNPCPFTADSPVWIDNGTANGCYCCCSCFAYGTAVAFDVDKFKAIESFVVGDTVLAATRDLKWELRAVEFSQGVFPSPEDGKMAVTVYYELGAQDQRKLVVTPNHVFMLADKKTLKRASDLDVEKDMLLDAATGKGVPLLGKEIGGWWLGLHHIATTGDASVDVDYHLLNSNGVVTGDWALQMVQSSSTRDGEWKAAKPVGRASFRQLKAGFDPEPLRPQGFTPYSTEAMRIPQNAQQFFTAKQSQELLESGHILPPEATGIQEPLYYVFRQLHYYYPNVFYDLVWDEEKPNIHSFVEHGLQFVVITGGMARIDCMNMAGLYMALASATGRLVGGPPLVPKIPHEFSCVGQADYFATLAVLRNILFTTDYRTQTFAGLEVLKTMFGYLADQKGVPGNRCNLIPLSCRTLAFEAGKAMMPLPWCAGGPETDFLRVKSAMAMPYTKPAKVVVQFNEPVNAVSACELQNYVFDPAGKVVSVNMKDGSDDTVEIMADLETVIVYKLTMRNIISQGGQGFENDKAVEHVRVPHP